MTNSGDLEARLSAVEREVALARADAEAARTLAAGADRDVSEVRAELRAHTQVLNALGQTQAEMASVLVDHTRRLDRLEAKFDDMDQRMTQGFATLGEGMQQIHALLSRIAP